MLIVSENSRQSHVLSILMKIPSPCGGMDKMAPNMAHGFYSAKIQK